jgi:hypothetical protein
MGTWSFQGVNRPERGVDHPPPYIAEVKERVEVYIDIDIDIFVNCSWVDTRWQYTFTHKQYIEHHN